VNEYRHMTAPDDRRLQGAHGGGINVLMAPSLDSVSKGETGAGGFSRIFKLIFSTPRHSTPNRMIKNPMAKKNARHMVFNLLTVSLVEAVQRRRCLAGGTANGHASAS
jgi:hypothetical protein